jgi:hypothetical protein
LLGKGIAEEAFLADFTAEAFSVEQTLKTFTRFTSAVARSRKINVVATLARSALATKDFWIPKIVVSADVTAGSGVAFLAFANHVLGFAVQRAPRSVRMSRIDGSWARAGTARNVDTQTRVSVITVQATVAMVVGRKIATVKASACS